MPRSLRSVIRSVLKFLLFVAALGTAIASFAGEKVIASRVWPAQEYTRVTIESPNAIRHQFFFVASPSGSSWTWRASTSTMS